MITGLDQAHRGTARRDRLSRSALLGASARLLCLHTFMGGHMGAGTIIAGIAIIAGVVLLRYGLRWYDLWTMDRAEQRRRAEDHERRA
ncbi:hypothetical protein [Actinopolymorpha pittospori]